MLNLEELLTVQYITWRCCRITITQKSGESAFETRKVPLYLDYIPFTIVSVDL